MAVDFDALDNFMNDASDQASAWFSIIKQRPQIVPSVMIAQQQSAAALEELRAVQTLPQGMDGVMFATTAAVPAVVTNNMPLIVLGLAAVVVYLMVKS